MKILALECSAKSCSAAVCDGERLISYFYSDGAQTHSVGLMPMAEAALERADTSPADIDVFAVTAGPGSFTGVRIGVAAIKGLAFGRESACCASVSALEAAAENLVGLDGVICAAMDARRSQVYTACFESVDGRLRRLTEDAAMSLSELGERLRELSHGRTVRLCGDGYNVARDCLIGLDGISLAKTPIQLRLQNACGTARRAAAIASEGGLVTADVLSPIYLRLPQAERERLEREKHQNKN